VEFDDEEGDEQTGPPLPPEDRLWRHPSEMAAAGPAGFIGRVSSPPRLVTVAVVAGTLGALLATGVSYATQHQSVRTVAVPALERRVEPVTVVSLSGQRTASVDVMSLVARMAPAVVRLEGRSSSGPVTGSAVLFRSDGFALTDAHLLSGVAAVTGVLWDRRRVNVRVVGIDPDSDVAVVKLDGTGFSVAPLATTSTAAVGQPIVAIGSTSTTGVPIVTLGNVTAVGRSVADGSHQLIGMIETDAPPGPEAMGGALLDVYGAVIGITTAVGSTHTAKGLAVPVDLAYTSATEIIAAGRVTPAWLGVDGVDLDAALAKELDLTGGAVIKHVRDLSPAASCGMLPGDVITSIDGRAVASIAELLVALRSHQPGDRLIVHVRRGDAEQVLLPVLSSRPADA
jgi:S1-C subfamily serine protease